MILRKHRVFGIYLRHIALMAVLGLVLMSCGGGTAETPTTAAETPTTAAETPTTAAETPTTAAEATTTVAPAEPISVRVAFNPGTALRLYAALSADLFAKHGLDVELVTFESGAATNAAFASGDVDLGFTGIPGIFASRLAGAGTRVFMIDNDGWKAEGLVVRPDSGIASVADLEGKTIGTVIGTTSYVGLVAGLIAEGVDPSLVDIVNVAPSAWIQAFDKGDVDGIWGWSPLLFMMAEAGGTIIATDSDYVLDPLLWQARGDFIDEHPEAVEAFVAAYEEAASLVAARDQGFVDKMIEMTGTSESVVRSTIDAVKPVSVEESVTVESPYSLVNPAGLRAILDEWLELLVEQQIFQMRPDLDGVIDPAPIQNHLGQG